MAKSGAGLGDFGAGAVRHEGVIEPSFRHALLYFQSLAVFPLAILAVTYGGWWFAGSIAFMVLVESLDGAFGQEERNMDPERTLEGQLFWYEVTLWLWAALWPITLVYSLWQILVVGHLAIWEIVVMAIVLANIAQAVFIVGHELVHRRSTWERLLGEFLLASVSYPHYATEHVYVHHAHACTPADAGSAPKGVSFWRHLPQDLKGSLVESWKFAHTRLARRHLPAWHYTNPFWRYASETAAWYALVYVLGGPWAVLVYVGGCLNAVLSMKIINYAQHYGLQRIRLPGGRFEKIQPWHSWTASSRFTNWLFYNMQRHGNHHIEATRHYPVLQHYGEDESPKLPGSYLRVSGWVIFPRRWFQKMDPLVDRWREKFYPQVDDWRAYDSPAFAARPDAFETIAEIHAAAPRLAAWINRTPERLDSLQAREFTDLDLPEGFGPDSKFEMLARQGLARLYWTREFGVSEMMERIAEVPALSAREVTEVARELTNDKVFQLGVHAMRGSLKPDEAGVALGNICEASIAALLSVVESEYANRLTYRGEGSVAVVVLGDLAGPEAAPGAELDVVCIYNGEPAHYYEGLCDDFLKELPALLHESLLFSPTLRERAGKAVYSLPDFKKRYRTVDSPDELMDLARVRCVYASGNTGIRQQFDKARHEIMAYGAAREAWMAELRETGASASEADPLSVDGIRDGLREVERAARLLQLTHVGNVPEIMTADPAAAFEIAGEHGLIPADAAKRLAAAMRMWRNLRGAGRWLSVDGFDVESAPPEFKAAVARACAVEDVDALVAAIRETAARVPADVDALKA